jgi:hypothetical protein
VVPVPDQVKKRLFNEFVLNNHVMKFSKLALLGDLRQYSMNELNEHLGSWKFTSTTKGDIITAEWCGSTTTLIVLYAPEGEFIQIVEERWKCFLFKDKVFRRSKNY